MMLNSKYTYIGIDFETTGLDTTKDVPIQIGIVKIDDQGNIVDSFESLIKPDKDIKELKNIVQFITKIDLAQLVFAPTVEEILPQIQHFFGENVIIIGHNINFDVAFLQNFFPTLQYYVVLDTFQLSQALIPYPQSYALEILIQHLEDKPLFLEQKTKFGLQFSGDTKIFHNALYDATSTIALFCYLISYIYQLKTEYPVLGQIFQKSDALLSKILSQLPIAGKGIGIISLPSLKKIAPKDTSLTRFPYPIEIKNMNNLHRYYVGNLPFKSLLESLLANKKMILVFASKPKLDIAKNTLFEKGIKNIGFAREEQTISPELFSKFLNKSTFTQPELYFIIKYCSNLLLGYGVLDLNSKGDYMVYNFIKDERQIIKYPLVLTTHHGLYSILEKEAHVYAEFDIVFFDVEWRYKNYNAYLSRTCDLYYIQNFVDMLVYKYQLLHEEQLFSEKKLQSLLAFDSFFAMFIGILRTETKKLFINRPEDELQINPIINNIAFYQTNLLLPKLKAFEQQLKDTLQENDFQVLRKQITHFFNICDTIAKVQRKLWSPSDFYFLFSEETKFTNRDEFTEIFTNNHIVFFSHHEASYPKLVEIGEKSDKKLPHCNTLSSLENRIQSLTSTQEVSIFIISTIKEESRAIFEYLQKLPFLTTYELLVENITGGAGKNIFKANKKVAKIIVGGYNFLMMCYAQRVKFDDIIIRNIKGAQSKLILDDILRYDPT